METEDHKFKLLLQKYGENQCSEEEIAWLESWYLQLNEASQERLSRAELDEASPLIWKAIESRITTVRTISLWPRIALAASLIIALTTGLYFFNQRNSTGPAKQVAYKKDTITPGGNKAYLTLADGRKISLTEAVDGEIANQAGIKITKTADGQLVYTVSDLQSPNSNLLYNTIETPRGGQYQVRLPDGSNVWLNAASSLKYPASFAAVQERRVELSGEAYFEVAKDKSRPFIVIADKQEVEVLGTHFNISSYADEAATKTTLLEGSVHVSSKNLSKVLKPGEQSVLTDHLEVSRVDVSQAIDWKEGSFYFADENLRTIMREVARWYDVEVVYETEVPDFGFGGEISMTKKLPEVLKILETTGKIHFKIEGRRVSVMK